MQASICLSFRRIYGLVGPPTCGQFVTMRPAFYDYGKINVRFSFPNRMKIGGGIPHSAISDMV